MSATPAPRRRQRKKTWSSFGPIQRKPNDYEIVTHNMNHTTGDTPLEMGPDVHGNVWLRKYRDDIEVTVPSWDDFRDPDRVTYDSYVKMQDEAEGFVDKLLENFTAEESSDDGLSSDCLTLLGEALTPQRYLVHAQQMLSAYVQQLAPSSYVANCASFQAADQLRRVQRVAYRTKQLDTAHPDRGFGSNEREIWENDARWQPIRKVLEHLLAVYAWDEASVAYNLVVRPVLDELFLGQLARAARALGDELDALVLENLKQDSRRHDRWAVALSKFAIAENPENRDTLRRLSDKWVAVVDEVITAGAQLITDHVPDLSSESVERPVRYRLAQVRAEAGLAADA